MGFLKFIVQVFLCVLSCRGWVEKGGGSKGGGSKGGGPNPEKVGARRVGGAEGWAVAAFGHPYLAEFGQFLLTVFG